MSATPRPLICLGGTLCDARLFAPLLSRLSRPGRVWSHNQHDRVADAATGLMQAAPEEFVVLGFSLGGFVALDALRLAPHRIAGVVLLSGNAFPDNPENAKVRRDDVQAARREGLRVWMRSREAMLVSPSCRARNEIIDLIGDMAQAEGDEVHARQAEMNIHRPDLRAVAKASPRPILALSGLDDRVCPRDRYLDLEGGHNTTLMMVEGAGHFLPLESPVPCAEAIETFLKEHDL